MAAAHSLCGRSWPTDTPRLPQANSENPEGLMTKCRSFWVAPARSVQFIAARPPIDRPGMTAEGGTEAGSKIQVRGMMAVRWRKSSCQNSDCQYGVSAG